MYNLVQGEDYPIGDPPPDLRGLQRPALDPILPDGLEEGQDYGDTLIDVEPSYQQVRVRGFFAGECLAGIVCRTL